jgi:hypothetical protein
MILATFSKAAIAATPGIGRPEAATLVPDKELREIDRHAISN